MKDSSDILERIVARKVEEIAERQLLYKLTDLEVAVKNQEGPRGFVDAIAAALIAGKAAVIAEVKKASPSKGVIRPDFDPEMIAASYARHGATCLSVVTDADFFQGQNEFLTGSRATSGLPTLRKDFVIDPWQVAESRAIGADCVLLIVAALEDAQMAELAAASSSYGMDVLLEVHDRQELERALAVGPRLIGINNRNLHTFETRLETTLELLDEIPGDQLVVTESGIASAGDVARMRTAGVHAFLIGETLLRTTDPGETLVALFGPTSLIGDHS
jgi:indole-3-glycerol phosphate synthase